jgi:putative sterol carrier protein
MTANEVQQAQQPSAEPDQFDTETLARLVRSTPDELLKEGLRKNREVMFREIFRRFPERLTEEGKRQAGVIKFKISAEGGEVDRWFVALRNGECETGQDSEETPRTTISLDALNFLKLVTGNANPIELFLRRRIRVYGDLIFAAKLSGFFSIPSKR